MDRTPFHQVQDSNDVHSPCDLSEDDMINYNKYLSRAKKYCSDGQLDKGLKYFKAAFKMCPTQKIANRITKVKEALKASNAATDEVDEKSLQVEEGRTEKAAPFDKNNFYEFIEKARSKIESCAYEEALQLYVKAFEIHPSDKVKRKINKIQAYLKENRSSSASPTCPSETSSPPPSSVMKRAVPGSVAQQLFRPSTPSSKRVVPQQIATTSQSSPLPDQEMKHVERLLTRAKDHLRADRVKEALELYKEAYALHANEQIKKKINKIEEALRLYPLEDDEAVDDMVKLGDGFALNKKLYESLYVHQRTGVLWMYGLFRKKKGGILGDDMGLGKTVQVIALLSGLFDAQLINSVLIVLPVAVMINWENEFQKWAPGIEVTSFHQESVNTKVKRLRDIHRKKGGVVLTSFGMLVRPDNVKLLSSVSGKEVVWDYVILDEGHKIKNASTKSSKGVHSIPARNRLILSGTPIQNNLKELWTLFNWSNQGTLLGTQQTFKMQFENPIVKAREKDATAAEQRLGLEMANSLRAIINPYFLRRTKAEVSQGSGRGVAGSQGGQVLHMPSMMRKNDFVCWVFLSEVQLQIYRDFLESEDVKLLLNTSKSPLTALTALKKICDHPRLMSYGQCVKLGLMADHSMNTSQELPEELSNVPATTKINNIPNHVLIEESGKMVFLMDLLDHLRDTGHRTLVFSQSRKMLDIIQKVLQDREHRVTRLDGTVTKLSERQEIIKRFSETTGYSVFLLTTQVGGVGLTLTAADRVVIFDPSWNPATDNQAVDRVFRIGQTRNVVIYRLITCGSVEEKIYRRQVFKSSITKQTTGDKDNPFRYFTQNQLRDLFVLDEPTFSLTQTQLEELHRGQRREYSELDQHLTYLHTLKMFGISDHDLLFDKDEQVDEVEDEEHESRIKIQVEGARRLLSVESQENQNRAEREGRYISTEVFNPRQNVRGAVVPGSFVRTSPSDVALNRLKDLSVVTVGDETLDDSTSETRSSEAPPNIQGLSEEEQVALAIQMSMIQEKKPSHCLWSQLDAEPPTAAKDPSPRKLAEESFSDDSVRRVQRSVMIIDDSGDEDSRQDSVGTTFVKMESLDGSPDPGPSATDDRKEWQGPTTRKEITFPHGVSTPDKQQSITESDLYTDDEEEKTEMEVDDYKPPRTTGRRSVSAGINPGRPLLAVLNSPVVQNQVLDFSPSLASRPSSGADRLSIDEYTDFVHDMQNRVNSTRVAGSYHPDQYAETDEDEEAIDEDEREEEDRSTEGEDASTEGEDASTEGEDASTEGEDASTEGEDASTEGEDASTERQDGRIEGEEEIKSEEDESEEDALTEEDESKYIELMTQSKHQYKTGLYAAALQYAQQGLQIYEDRNGQLWVEKIRKKLEDQLRE